MFLAKSEVNVDEKLETITICMDFIGKNLAKCKLKDGEKARVELLAKEVIARMIESNDNKNNKSPIFIKIHSFLGKCKIRITCSGSPIKAEEILENLSPDNIIDGKNFNGVNNKKGFNICEIYASVEKASFIKKVFTALVLGIVMGCTMKHFPMELSKFLVDNIFDTLYSLFFNALKMIIAPLVFFSLADGVSQYTNIETFGRVATKALTCFFISAVIAMLVGLGIYHIFPIGDASLQSIVANAGNSEIQTQGVLLSIKEILLSFIPTDIITPFSTNNTLQILILALITAISMATLGQCTTLKNFVSGVNKLLLKITSIIINFMPIAIFCSIANLTYGINIGHLLKVVVWVPVIFCGHCAMFIIYLFMVFILTRHNPFVFVKNILPALLSATSTTSGTVAMPLTMKCCKDKLRISPKIYTFLIPLATSIQKDGTCVTLTATTFFVAKIFGITFTPQLILRLFFMILVLTMGVANMPGSSLVCMAVIFPVFGIPIESITLIAGLYPLVSMTSTFICVTGNVAITYIIAKSEKMVE